MRYVLTSVGVLLAGLSACAVGCGSNSQPPTVSAQPPAPPVPVTPASHASETPEAPAHSVAVLDLDTVAKRVGRLDEINAAVKERQADLNERMEILRRSYQFEFDQKKSEFGDAPTDEQQKQLATIQQRMNNGIVQARQQAQQELALHQNALRTRFHEEVRPLARRIAEGRGMSVVITQNFVFAAPETVDITNEVVEQMMKQISTRDESPAASTARRLDDAPSDVIAPPSE